MRTHILLPLVALLVAVVGTGCVADTRPAACAEPSVTIELEIQEGDIVSNDPAVCRDQEVTLIVTVDEPGTFHIHGYDHAAPAAEVEPNEPLELEFVADQAGQFTIELHTQGGTGDQAVGIFSVHEP